MEAGKIRAELENPGTVLIDVDPAPYLEIGFPEGAISHPLSSEPWEEILERLVGKNHSNVAIFASFRAIGEYAERLATEYGMPVSFMFCEGIGKWAEMGLPVARINSIDVGTLMHSFQEFEIIDVREREELKSGFIEGSLNIPLSEIDNALLKMNIGKKYAVICAHGNRSREAAKILSEYGFNACTVKGGMSQWILKSFPTVD